MAIGKVNTLQEGFSRKLYTGVCPVKCIALNPNKKELEAIYGREMQKEPVYTDTVEVEVNKEKKTVKRVKLDFYLKNEELDLITRVSIPISDYYPVSTKTGNYQIIDRYGNSTWTSPETIKAKGLPLSSSGNPMSITTDYHLAKRGEVDLVLFIQSLLGIANSFIRVDGQWVLRPSNLDECVCCIDDINKIIDGNVTELRSLIKLGEQNFVKVLLGVSTNNGKNYQSVYPSFFAKNSVSSTTVNGEVVYPKFKATIEDARKQSTTSSGPAFDFFTFGEAQEYNPNPTKFEAKKTEEDLPF